MLVISVSQDSLLSQMGLGHDFLLQIEVGLKFIQRNPELTTVEYKEAREAYHLNAIGSKWKETISDKGT
jgi:hypothetical protein